MVEEFADRWFALGRTLGTTEIDQLTTLCAGALYSSEAVSAPGAGNSNTDWRVVMGHLGGSASAEIDAPLEAVWAVVQDVMAAPEWQGGLDKMSRAGARPGTVAPDAGRDRE